MHSIKTSAQHFDRPLLLAVLGLLVVGIVMVYSSSSVAALTTYNDPAFFMKRQILWAMIGLFFMAVAMHTDHMILSEKMAVVGFLILSFLLMAATLVPELGREVNGAKRWVRLGELSFQPSELAKFGLVIYLGYYISNKAERIRDFVNGLLPGLVVTGIFVLLCAFQPDFGTAIIIAGVAFVMLYAGGARLAHLLGLLVVGILIAYYAVAGAAYRRQRILAFLDPWADPTGSGHQIIQSFLALGSGGIFGRGLGEGRQKLLFLPERHSDFIYAVIGEELGLIGAMLVLILFLIIFWRGVRICMMAEHPFSRLLALGITILITIQAFVNMAVVTGLLPTKGIVLPLVSYGGSSLIVTMLGAGVLLNISKVAK